jgi:hypothetical protein
VCIENEVIISRSSELMVCIKPEGHGNHWEGFEKSEARTVERGAGAA